MDYIKFTEDRSTVEAEPQHFEAGRVYHLPVPSCERWIKRNAAVPATEAEFKAQDQAKPAKKGGKKQGAQAPAQKAEAERQVLALQAYIQDLEQRIAEAVATDDLPALEAELAGKRAALSELLDTGAPD